MNLLAAVNASSVVQGSEDSALTALRSHSQLMKREIKHVRGGGTRPVREGPLDNVFSSKATMSEESVDDGVLSDHKQLKNEELIEANDFEKFRDDQQGRTTIHPRTLSEVSNYTTQGRTGLWERPHSLSAVVSALFSRFGSHHRIFNSDVTPGSHRHVSRRICSL